MLVIREATASDAPLIVEMIRELAHFERELDQVDTTPDDLVRDGFGENPSFHAFVAEWDGQPAAYILYFFTYSTWAGRPVGMQRHDGMPSRFLTRYADITDHTAKSPTRCKNAEALAPNPCPIPQEISRNPLSRRPDPSRELGSSVRVRMLPVISSRRYMHETGLYVQWN